MVRSKTHTRYHDCCMELPQAAWEARGDGQKTYGFEKLHFRLRRTLAVLGGSGGAIS